MYKRTAQILEDKNNSFKRKGAYRLKKKGMSADNKGIIGCIIQIILLCGAIHYENYLNTKLLSLRGGPP